MVPKGELNMITPYGYDYVVNRKEQTIMLGVQVLHRNGQTLTAIAHGLNRDGVPTKTGVGVWGHQQVRRLVEREVVGIPS